jgi:GDP-mannose 6-dehydrogenase
MKKIGVFGLGYVGVVTAACFAKEGHHVIGIDVSEEKVNLLNKGESPIVEEHIGELIRAGVNSGKLKSYTDASIAIEQSDIIFICVGTPSARNGSLDTSYIKKVCIDIGSRLAESDKIPLVVVRSTLIPGSIETVVIPSLEESAGRSIDKVAKVLFHPEFLREGSSVYDFNFPPKIVVGESENGGGKELLELYENIEAPRFVVNYKIAEMVKYCDNMFHALKVTFGNEIGQFCKAYGIDSHEVMNIFISDEKLNISNKYLRPGFAFGGSCLPKDLRAFNYLANTYDIKTPMLESILVSNKMLIENIAENIIGLKVSKIGFYGLSFKKGTDDLRESPLVTLAEILLGRGVEILVFDDFVNLAKLIGGNKSYINAKLAHISDLLVKDIETIEQCDLIVLGHQPPKELLDKWKGQSKKLLDLNHPGGPLDSK